MTWHNLLDIYRSESKVHVLYLKVTAGSSAHACLNIGLGSNSGVRAGWHFAQTQSWVPLCEKNWYEPMDQGTLLLCFILALSVGQPALLPSTEGLNHQEEDHHASSLFSEFSSWNDEDDLDVQGKNHSFSLKSDFHYYRRQLYKEVNYLWRWYKSQRAWNCKWKLAIIMLFRQTWFDCQW